MNENKLKRGWVWPFKKNSLKQKNSVLGESLDFSVPRFIEIDSS